MKAGEKTKRKLHKLGVRTLVSNRNTNATYRKNGIGNEQKHTNT